MRFLPHSLRWQLTLWYSLGLSAMLALGAAGSWHLLRRVLEERADRFLTEARDAFVVELEAERRALPTTAEATRAAMRDIRFSDIEFVVLDSALRAIAASNTFATQATSDLPAPRLDSRRLAHLLEVEHRGARGLLRERLLTMPDPDTGIRMAVTNVDLEGAPLLIVAAQSRRWLRETLAAVTTAYLTAIPVLLLLAGAGGYLLARRALEPVAAMGRQTRAIEAANLHERLPVDDPHGEMGGLATVVNDLLARLEDAFAQQRRLVADASHELRTPVAVLRAEADVALSQPTRPEAEYREALRVVQDAGRRLSRIVDDLFVLARADGGPVPMRREPLYFDELVADTVRVLRALAAQRDVRIEASPLAETLVHGDPDLLGRLLINLIENAVKYSPPGSTVALRLDHEGDAAVLSITDQGPGIPQEARARVFERFFRADEARPDTASPAPHGAGLGLAIAKWVTEAHGGSLALVRSSPEGSEFRVTLPVGNASEGTSAVAGPGP